MSSAASKRESQNVVRLTIFFVISLLFETIDAAWQCRTNTTSSRAENTCRSNDRSTSAAISSVTSSASGGTELGLSLRQVEQRTGIPQLTALPLGHGEQNLEERRPAATPRCRPGVPVADLCQRRPELTAHCRTSTPTSTPSTAPTSQQRSLRDLVEHCGERPHQPRHPDHHDRASEITTMKGEHHDSEPNQPERPPPGPPVADRRILRHSWGRPPPDPENRP